MTANSKKMNDLTSKTTGKLKLEASKLPSNVLSDVREFLVENRYDVKTNDDADFVIQNSTVEELFDYYLVWNGIIGFTGQFIEALDGIRAYVQTPIRGDRTVKVQHKGGQVYVTLTADLRVKRVNLGGDYLDITEGLRSGRVEGLDAIERKAVRKALSDDAKAVR